MHESRVKLEYPFGEITIETGVSGNVDRPNQVITHMTATAATVTSTEVVQRGIADSHRGSGQLQQECSSSTRFGEIEVSAKINFNLKQQVSKRTLNSMVFEGILPKIWQTASIYFGDNHSYTTPQEPLAQRPHSDVLGKIDDVLGLPSAPSRLLSEPYNPYGSQSDQQRQRQPALR